MLSSPLLSDAAAAAAASAGDDGDDVAMPESASLRDAMVLFLDSWVALDDDDGDDACVEDAVLEWVCWCCCLTSPSVPCTS